MVEGARLESVCQKSYQGFESLSLRQSNWVYTGHMGEVTVPSGSPASGSLSLTCQLIRGEKAPFAWGSVHIERMRARGSQGLDRARWLYDALVEVSGFGGT